MPTLIQPIRYAIRQLRRAPMFSLTVVLTLAVGIGANAAIFSVIDTVLLRPLGYRDADRIVAINTRFVEESRNHVRLGGDDYFDLSSQVQSLESTAYYQFSEDGLQLNGHAIYTRMAYTSPLFGQVLGVQPAAGRLFTNSADATQEVLVSTSFAQENFASIGAAIGRTVSYDGAPRSIVGVLPEGFSYPDRTQVWIGQNPRPEVRNRTAYNQRVIARMRPGVSFEALSAELAGFSRQLAATYPEDRTKAIIALPLQEQLVGKVRPMLNLIMGAVGVILLIVCANIAHLQLVRATRSQHQVALRTALGATRSDLASGAMLQAAILAIAGAAAGLTLATPLLRLILRLAPQDLPRLAEIHLNPHVFAFCFAISLLAMLVTALLPVWRSWHIDPTTALKQDSSRGLTGESSSRLRSILVVAEVAMTFLLSVAAILLVQQMSRLSRASVGFDPDRLIVIDSHAPGRTKEEIKSNPTVSVLRLNAVLDRIQQIPGVDHVSAVSGVPMGSGGHSNVMYAIHGRSTFDVSNLKKLADAYIIPITPGYFAATHVPLLRGRILTSEDTLTNRPVVVISKSLADQQFADQDPLGHEILCGFDEIGKWETIVGVVDDVLQDSPSARPYPTFYVPLAQHPGPAADATLVVRTHGDPAAQTASIERAIREVNPAIAFTTSTMRQEMGASLRGEQFRTLLFGSFAGISILLAAIGMYGVTAYTVAQRRFEFALRFAFGAERGQVFAMVLRSASLLALAGVATGAVLVVLATRMLGSVLTGVKLLDPISWALALVLVGAISLAATLIPARRAAATDPMEALRSE